jgi:hypothetical protein
MSFQIPAPHCPCRSIAVMEPTKHAMGTLTAVKIIQQQTDANRLNGRHSTPIGTLHGQPD